MHQELYEIRSQLSAAIARIDRILTGAAPAIDISGSRWRNSPGGSLSPEGVTEIHRRFEEGETDAIIARAMGITVQGVHKRRADWKATRI